MRSQLGFTKHGLNLLASPRLSILSVCLSSHNNSRTGERNFVKFDTGNIFL
jgi:hypothetical protein